MTGWDRGLLAPAQARLVARWLGAPVLVDDLSWGIVDSTVLHVRAGDRAYIVKAGGERNHHLDREIDAHDGYTAVLVERGLVGALRHADRGERVLVIDRLPGDLVSGTAAEIDADLHRQAGRALAVLHAGPGRVDETYEQRVTARTLAWLDADHRIAPEVETRARRILETQRGGAVRVVPTHGDWQPRNWLDDDGVLRVIDFGRFALRPASSDLCRLAAQQWRDRPDLAAAFVEGYGSDPRSDPLWPVEQLREAVGTAAYAFQIGDPVFEAQGQRMLADALRAFPDV
ncbi:phosphotransferase [Streptomyces sp. AC495_CC817]|uniref:phosphotransferase n=1 Tax=Streptomyces sp. AC495_CC817 TaxID=2823900 RepID=UPI001C25D9B0|nr:phosphotransferase [Streptomyces sp. AC495_CC817]